MSLSGTERDVTWLKDIANRLFREQKYPQASEVYTNAINLDKTNATLWANRAACRHAMKLYIGAVYDAEKAVQLDPNYTKAHARVAWARDALNQPWLSVESWRLAAITSNNPTSETAVSETIARLQQAFRSMKVSDEVPGPASMTDYEQGLKKAVYGMLKPPKKTFRFPDGTTGEHSTPWLSAISAKYDAYFGFLIKDNESCTGYLGHMYMLYRFAVEMLSGQWTDEHIDPDILKPERPNMIPYSTVQALTNVLFYDKRIFHIPDYETRDGFRFKIASQIATDAYVARVVSWVEDDDMDTIKQSARERLQKEGWRGHSWISGLSAALGMTVRCWVLYGFVDSEFENKPEDEAEYLEKAIKLIEWCRDEWKDVSDSDRGFVMGPIYLRLIQVRYLENLQRLLHYEPNNTSSYFEKIGAIAEEIIESVENDSSISRESNPAMKRALYHHPKGHALAQRAFCLYHEAELASDTGVSDLAREKACKAVETYVEAAECFVVDDEYYTHYLFQAVKIVSDSPALKLKTPTVEEIFSLAERIDDALAAMLWIWELYVVEQGRYTDYLRVNVLVRKIKSMMEKEGWSRNDLRKKTILMERPLDWRGMKIVDL
ncbi:hypothetical protein VKT23_006019 [Stygiomarasmius scandens]|uniref:TPR-like protein n=1 Tax=Marasmiellus scandens TaxID=2682957 RepID=A0ABR1JRX0_9AGAR